VPEVEVEGRVGADQASGLGERQARLTEQHEALAQGQDSLRLELAFAQPHTAFACNSHSTRRFCSSRRRIATVAGWPQTSHVFFFSDWTVRSSSTPPQSIRPVSFLSLIVALGASVTHFYTILNPDARLQLIRGMPL
jgi:hypothetical protein